MNSKPDPKPIPRSVAIFGAGGHIGGPMAQYIRFHAPDVALRLISSQPDNVAQLRRSYPGTDVVQASYFDPPSLEAALSGIEGMLILTTERTDERIAMSNVVAAVQKSNTLTHMIRITGMQPDHNPRRITRELREAKMGLEVQHPIARQVLDDAEMPVTYLNCAASYMDNLLRSIPGLAENDTLSWPERDVTYVDPREVGEAAARLILSDEPRHLYQFYSLNNGEDPIRTSAIARMMRDVFLRPIGHDGSRETFFGIFTPLEAAGAVPRDFAKNLWNFFVYEDENATIWVPNQFLERTLDRKPTTLRAWLQEHRAVFFSDDDAPVATGTRPAPATEAVSPTGEDNGIDGVWDCTVSTPMGLEHFELDMRVGDDGTLAGAMTSVKGRDVSPLVGGSAAGNRLRWTMQLVKPIKLKLKVDVELDGDTLSGQAAAILGKSAITGKRRG